MMVPSSLFWAPETAIGFKGFAALYCEPDHERLFSTNVTWDAKSQLPYTARPSDSPVPHRSQAGILLESRFSLWDKPGGSQLEFGIAPVMHQREGVTGCACCAWPYKAPGPGRGRPARSGALGRLGSKKRMGAAPSHGSSARAKAIPDQGGLCYSKIIDRSTSRKKLV
jgi:hypothetical protein